MPCEITLCQAPSRRLATARAQITARSLALRSGPCSTRSEVYGDWHDDPQQLRTEVFYLLG